MAEQTFKKEVEYYYSANPERWNYVGESEITVTITLAEYRHNVETIAKHAEEVKKLSSKIDELEERCDELDEQRKAAITRLEMCLTSTIEGE